VVFAKFYRMKRNQLYGGFFIIAGSLLFISALMTCIILNSGPSHGLEGPTTTVPISIIGSAPVEQSNIITPNGSEGDLVIRLRLQGLSVSSRELTCLVDLKVSTRFKEDLWDSTENTTVADYTNGLTLKTKYAEYLLPLEINECSSGSSILVQIPLKNLFLPDTETCPQPSKAVQITLPVTGRPQLYPEDWYLLNATFALPWHGSIFPGTIKPPPGTCLIPPEIEVFSDVALSNKHIVMQQYPSSCGGAVKLLLTTNIFTRVYTWTIMFIPILLFLVFIHVLYVNSDFRGKPINNLIAGVIAAIIAVLPLRIVLVPSEIPGLTCVDLILALGMASIFALVIVTYGVEILNKANKKTKRSK
jgi:hypothetical protein